MIAIEWSEWRFGSYRLGEHLPAAPALFPLIKLLGQLFVEVAHAVTFRPA